MFQIVLATNELRVLCNPKYFTFFWPLSDQACGYYLIIYDTFFKPHKINVYKLIINIFNAKEHSTVKRLSATSYLYFAHESKMNCKMHYVDGAISPIIFHNLHLHV